jgi:uncharacterized Zn finger protein
MLRALAAELSDPGRFSRAKAYARDGAVTDIVVESGAVCGQVQGSRYEPYDVTIHVAPAADGEGVLGLIPERGELLAECSCPDAETFGTCKHSLAVLLVLADEITIEPEVLARWRAGEVADRPLATRSAAATEADVLAPLLVAPGAVPDRFDIPPRLAVAMAATTDPRDADVTAAVAAAIAAMRTR